MGVWYDPLRDGTLDEYIKRFKQNRISGYFKGHEQFRQLADSGYLTPNVTSIRIMYGSERDDEFYFVVDDFRLEGAELRAHSGRKGIYDPREVLSEDTPHFEVEMMNPNPRL